MTSKAYIIANEQQECEVLTKLEQEEYVWSGGEKPTEWIPSKHFITDDNFPIAIINDLSKHITFDSDYDEFDNDATVVYDGRKEEYMSEKYVVSQDFIDALNEWKRSLVRVDADVKPFVGSYRLDNLPNHVSNWHATNKVSYEENNNRLIAIIRWVNGEDVFEVEKPKKWVVRSNVADEDGGFAYVLAGKDGISVTTWGKKYATKFDTKEEAESWANSHQEVIEVVDV